MSTATTAIVVAIITAVLSVGATLATQVLKARAERAAKAAEAEQLVARYRDPLLRSAYDLQSRIYNLLAEPRFTGDPHYPDYLRLSTLFVIAQFFGWLEIVRREMQFLDLGAEDKTRDLGEKLEAIQGSWSTTSQELPLDGYCIYRVQQRAVGDLMISRIDTSTRVGPQHECLGYADFVKKEDDFALAFDRLGRAIESLPDTIETHPEKRPDRLVRVQRDLIDLLDYLDPPPNPIRFPKNRERLPKRLSHDSPPP